MKPFRSNSNENKKTVNLKANESRSFKAVFEKKLKTILFKEPYFTEFLKDVKANVKPVNTGWSDEQRNLYTRYLQSLHISFKSDEVKRQQEAVREIQSHKLVNFVKECYKSGDNMYSDMQIYVEDQVFMVHRLIIACFIPLLFYRLSRKERLPETRKIRLNGINTKAFNEIIAYMYTGSVQPTDETFLDVLEVAFKFLMYEFAEIWIEIYEESLGTTTSRMLFRYRMSLKFGWNDYSRRIVQAIAIDFENLIISEAFLKLTPSELLEIVRQDEIGVQSEVVVFISILKWLNYDWQQRESSAGSVMNEIRFQHMSEEELFACLNPPILKAAIEIPEVKSLIADAINCVVNMKNSEIVTFKKVRRFRNTNSDNLRLWAYNESSKKRAQVQDGNKP